MSRGRRLTMLGIAAVIAAIAVVLAVTSGGDESKDDTTQSTAAQSTQTSPRDETTTTQARAEPPPRVDRIHVKGGEPVGGVQEIEVEKGDTVRIAVTSDVAEELHLHGYDISREVAAGATATMNFEAEIEGVFELELEQSGVEIAKLTVSP